MEPDPQAYRQDGIAQYLLIAQAISSWISGGKYRTGDQLPTVGELTSHFGVAKGTMHEALKELSKKGLIETSRGKRSVVKNNPRIFPVYTGVHLGEALAPGSSDQLSRKVLSVNRVSSAKVIQGNLPFELSDDLVEFRSILHVDKRPTVFMTSYIPAHRASNVSQLRGEELEIAFQKIIEAANKRQSRISATIVDFEISQQLNMPAGSPALRYRRLLWSNEKDLDVYIEAIFRSDDREYVLSDDV